MVYERLHFRDIYHFLQEYYYLLLYHNHQLPIELKRNTHLYPDLLQESFEDIDTPSYEEMKGLGEIAKKCLPDTEVVVVTDKVGFEII